MVREVHSFFALSKSFHQGAVCIDLRFIKKFFRAVTKRRRTSLKASINPLMESTTKISRRRRVRDPLSAEPIQIHLVVSQQSMSSRHVPPDKVVRDVQHMNSW